MMIMTMKTIIYYTLIIFILDAVVTVTSKTVDDDNPTSSSKSTTDTTNKIINNNNHNEDHPDPNDEDHIGMIYIGRTCSKSGRRLLANESYNIQYIFGSSFDADDSNINDENENSNKNEPKLKQFGHVHTHIKDGGIIPQQLVSIEPFWLDATPVTNEQFALFVASTYYITEAEKFGWSYVLDSLLYFASSDHQQSFHFPDKAYRIYEVDPDEESWIARQFTYWKEPYGQLSKYIPDHPVVHVSHYDAANYCKWRNHARLPGEREYEAAARWINPNHKPPKVQKYDPHGNPIVDDTDEDNEIENDDESFIPPRTIYAWGNNSDWETAIQYANLWGPGEFPHENAANDGYFGTSPVKTYPPNQNGLYDLTGNVWEWMRGGTSKARILRGSSFVDTLDGSINHAATLGARATTHGTTTASNIGFRCAKSVTKRIEHHWTWHDIDVDGPLLPEDEYIDDEDEVKNTDDDETIGQKKKKKVQIKNEQIRTEL